MQQICEKMRGKRFEIVFQEHYDSKKSPITKNKGAECLTFCTFVFCIYFTMSPTPLSMYIGL